MALPPIPQTKPYIPPEDRETLLSWFREILESGQLINGKFTQAFEEETAKAVGTRYAIAMNSCTSALQAALEYIDVRGKEVLVSVNTFIATSNAVILAGGNPVIVDIGENLLMDFEKIKTLITADTKAIIVVHIAGFVHPDIHAIREFCTERGIYLLEDAAHAHGASFRGTAAGAFGLAGAFSYYATKVLATGAGGMLTTNDEELMKRARSVRFHGEDRARGIQDRLGADWLMTEFQAALGLSQLRRLPNIIRARTDIALRYNEVLQGISGIEIFPLPPGSISGYYKYPVRVHSPLSKEAVTSVLESMGIKAGNIYWPPIHLQPFYRDTFGYTEGDFPVAEKVLSETFSLPLYPDMTQHEVERVIQALYAVLGAETRTIAFSPSAPPRVSER